MWGVGRSQAYMQILRSQPFTTTTIAMLHSPEFLNNFDPSNPNPHLASKSLLEANSWKYALEKCRSKCVQEKRSDGRMEMNPKRGRDRFTSNAFCSYQDSFGGICQGSGPMEVAQPIVIAQLHVPPFSRAPPCI